jgi:AhpD family alkylhydroperoxidase
MKSLNSNQFYKAKEQTMDVRMKELVFLGASVSAHCFPCFDYHLEKARELGICEEEIQESIQAGFMVMNGAGDKMLEKIKESWPEISFKGNESCSGDKKTEKSHHSSLIRF